MNFEPLSSRREASAIPGIAPRATIFRWIILGLVSFIYMLVAVDRVNLGIATPAIKAEFHITNAEAGLFSTLLFVCFAVTQLPSSLASRRFGARYMMMIALVIAAASSYLIGASSTPLEIKIFRSVLGVAEASISVCCISTINHWFSVRDRGTATGLYLGATKMGPVVFPPLIVLILQNFGWRAIFQLFAAPVLLTAVLWFFFVQNRPEQSKYVSARELEQIRDAASDANPALARAVRIPAWVDRVIRLRRLPVIDTVGGVFRSWNVIGNTIAYMFVIGIFNVFLAWIPSYLVSGKHLPLATAGLLASTFFAGAVSGNLTGGWLSDNILGMRRKPLMMLCTLFTSFALVSIIYAPPSEVLLAALLIMTGFAIGLGYPHFTVYPMGLTTREIYPVAFGVLNTGAGLVGGLFPLIAGMILDAYSWNVVFAFLSVSALVSFAFLVTIEERSSAA